MAADEAVLRLSLEYCFSSTSACDERRMIRGTIIFDSAPKTLDSEYM